MKERLIELIRQAKKTTKEANNDIQNLPLITHIAGYPINEVIDLMEAKNAGRVIELPCAVGDTLYIPFGNHIVELKVARIAIEPIEEIGFAFYCYGGCIFDNRDIGKTVFLTKEEAEKALENKQ